MKSSLILATTIAAGLVAAGPIEKRVLYTKWDIHTVTVTETGTPPQSTGTGNSNGFDWASFFANLRGNQSPATTTSVAPAPTTTFEAPASSQPAATFQAPPASSAAAPPAAASPAAASPAAAVPISSDYSQGILDAHNNHRTNHTVAGLTWSDRMAQYAQQIASSCVYAHNTAVGEKDFGQNIGAGVKDAGVPGMITNMMYDNEINFYPGYGKEPDMGQFEKWGHFSQIVWKNTVEVGCYTQYCPNGLANVGSNVPPYFTVCNYHPPGNYGGQYADNVLAPIGMATITI